MKILIAPDSMKDCLSAKQVASIIATGIGHVLPDAQVTNMPLADGGEGTTEVYVAATGGQISFANVRDPLMRPMKAKWGMSQDRQTAIIELASASGLELLTKTERNPWETTTYGTGQLIQEAIKAGVKNILLAIGGSATNDGGAGILAALGAEFTGSHQQKVKPAGGYLSKIHKANFMPALESLQSIALTVACDVKNPLTGPTGASYVYANQKGADEKMIIALDQNLKYWAEIIKRHTGRSIENIPGSGAAGGTGGGMLIFPHARLMPGFQMISKALNLEEHIKACDVVITAEGKTDKQTLSGKVPAEIAKLAQKYQKPAFLICGIAEKGHEGLYDLGISEIIPLSSSYTPTHETLEKAPYFLQKASEKIAKLLADGNY
ncbi:glycerate kinase [Cytophagaceae bacterium ABcell3]|nr:glycerate kinase [Cytophagaceae bacterium ABcell3]